MQHVLGTLRPSNEPLSGSTAFSSGCAGACDDCFGLQGVVDNPGTLNSGIYLKL